MAIVKLDVGIALYTAKRGWAAFRDAQPHEPCDVAFFTGFALALALVAETRNPHSDARAAGEAVSKIASELLS